MLIQKLNFCFFELIPEVPFQSTTPEQSIPFSSSQSGVSPTSIPDYMYTTTSYNDTGLIPPIYDPDYEDGSGDSPLIAAKGMSAATIAGKLRQNI